MTSLSTLPIEARLVAIREALVGHTRALLVAEPGAGKTTRVPLALLDAPWCRGGRLLLLEPRRIAARLAAGFMAETLGEPVGETVGYRMRGESRVGPATRLEVVTQGVLTRMLQDDPMLEGVAGILFDEFHERSLEADLGLALALDAQAGLRDDLRLLVMSATLDLDSLLGVLGQGTPVIDCPGRTFPVETRYRSLTGREEAASRQARAVFEALDDEAGDALVILPGVGEIRRLARELAGRRPDLAIMELHGRLPLEAQRRALRPDPGGRRRVVLATAIAESSVTVDGVRIVVDAGQERVPVFQPRSGLTRLETRRVNRASADQRRGRAGRQGPGVCVRLWAEEQPLIPHGEPEIRQADLAPLAFELARWGITEPSQLAWVTPPPPAALAAGRDLLRRLGVLDAAFHLTALGRASTRWPTHPRLAVMLERAVALDALPLACALVAALEGRDLEGEKDLERALEARLADGRAHRQWLHDARRLARLGGCRLEVASLAPLGELLALAYPERIAQRLAPGRFRLASGGLAVLPEEHPLAHAALLVAAELDGEAGGARIFRGVALSPDRLEALYPETAEWRASLAWSDEQGRLVGEQRRGLGAVVLERRPLQALPPEAVRRALLDALRRRRRLPFDEAAEQLRGRVALLRRELGDDWPDWSDAALLERLDDWLGPHLDGVTRLEAVDKLPLGRLLLDTLGWPLRSRLDELAPERLTVPSGSGIRLDYASCREGGEPVLAVKLQEVFGWRASPRVAGGRVPVLLHLLSPARRPLQVTRDLESFWANGYPEVRREMRGRYPRHPWPEDPLTAEATARTRRRG
ncbi:ATP-dependent helicase HrpB [Halomonas heilongjiangensis]|uniref:ATP-dependent helicase HrpB n=1 Tax=Halomonas heilongjiangensis TaxID=1387883 RepID=A0A2N7TNU0_9GAMM|nr:ATP-dependent helicase HrpB [Halomonas heilongjiangensis]PMR69845.1 ATP-dependent helicase HrpB [Halomonas heilongjiangensis]PXX90535.1 ATP-dependent helicase HrpB [Halomonas heilongjiangensis]